MLLANYIDRYNLLRVFVAPPHSDDSVVRFYRGLLLPLYLAWLYLLRLPSPGALYRGLRVASRHPLPSARHLPPLHAATRRPARHHLALP